MAFNNQNLTSVLNGLEGQVSRLIAQISGVRAQGPVGPGGQMPHFQGNQFGSMAMRQGGNLLQGSMAAFTGLQTQFNNMSPQRMQGLGNIAQGAGQTVSGLSSMMPDVQATVERAGTFYNATLRAGAGMSRPEMQQTTLEGMRGGLTSPGSDAMVGGYLAQRGMFASTKFNSNYQQTIRSVGNAAKYLNMDNATAAQSLANLTSGAGASNILSRYGIFTADPATGEKKTQGQIFEEIAERLTMGREGATVEETMDSIYSGNLMTEIAESGLDAGGQEMLASYLVERVKGNKMDLSDPEAMQKMMDKAKKDGNENPYLPGYDLNTAKTDAMGGAEGSYLGGIKAATKALEGLTKAGGAAAQALGFFKAGGDMLSGSPVAQGFGEILSGGLNVVKGILGFGGDNVVGNASAASLGATMMGGGGAAGFAGSQGRGAPIGGDTGSSNASASSSAGAPQAFKLVHPVSSPKITAVFGQKKSSYSGDIVWPNGHKGVDYAAKQGDPVYAAADGEVMSTDSGGELGNYVKIKHANGMHTFYAHLSSKSVSQGNVKQGQPIGSAGNTGTKSFGVHLHFALSTSGTTAGAIDPAPYMSGSASSLGVTASNPEQSSSGGTPAASGDTATGGSGEDTSGRTLSSATNILEITSSGYKASSGATGVSSVDSLSAASFVSAKTGASQAANRPNEGGEGYTGDEDTSVSVSPTGASRLLRGAKAKPSAGQVSTNNVTINLTISQATDDEAKRFALMVKRTLEEDSMMTRMART
jgi:murein DD-endopeptidase MepM/ murein hydrolase activator NlpD